MRILALLGLLLSACVASEPAVREDEAPWEAVSSWEEAREDASCTVPLCAEGHCALWRCRDLRTETAPPIVLARGTLTLRPPASPIRWWGHPLVLPVDRDPVFEIPWHNWNIRGQYAPKALRLPCIPSREPFEKHHIFPQESGLAKWFDKQGIDIHAFTIRLPKSFHSWLHSGSFKGGQWNEAWRQFQMDKPKATQAEMWRFAFELMDKLGVNGPLVSYYCK